MWKTICIVLLVTSDCVASVRNSGGQTVLTLNRLVDDWCLQSPVAQTKALNFKNQLLEFENYKKSFLPAVAFSFNPFSFNRSLKLVQYPEDGRYSYIEDFSNNSATGITINQEVGITGGQLTLGSNLNFFSDFTQKRNSFSTTPFFIGYNQQLFGGYKQYILNKKIEYIKNEAALKKYCTSLLKIQHETLDLFMDLLLAKLEQDLSLTNKQINDTLLTLAKLKLDNGNITPYEYQQVELQSLDNQYRLENSKKTFQEALRRLFTYLGREVPPGKLEVQEPVFNLPLRLDESSVFFYLRKNNPISLDFKEKQLEAEKTFYVIKLNNRLNGNVSLNYGINQYAETFAAAYKRPNVRQSATVAFQIPIFQWGINRNKVKIAENTYKSSLLTIKQEENEFFNQVAEEINTYNHTVNLWFIAERTYKLSREQYRLSAEKYALGKVSVYELTSSQQDQSAAMQKYYDAIKNVWNSYFSLREFCLYDFSKQEELVTRLIGE